MEEENVVIVFIHILKCGLEAAVMTLSRFILMLNFPFKVAVLDSSSLSLQCFAVSSS